MRRQPISLLSGRKIGEFDGNRYSPVLPSATPAFSAPLRTSRATFTAIHQASGLLNQESTCVDHLCFDLVGCNARRPTHAMRLPRRASNKSSSTSDLRPRTRIRPGRPSSIQVRVGFGAGFDRQFTHGKLKPADHLPLEKGNMRIAKLRTSARYLLTRSGGCAGCPLIQIELTASDAGGWLDASNKQSVSISGGAEKVVLKTFPILTGNAYPRNS